MHLLRSSVLLCFFCFAALQHSAQVSASRNLANFFTVYTNETDSVQFYIKNNSPLPYHVTDINNWHEDVFWVSDTSFTVNPGDSQFVMVYCQPRHNLSYFDFLHVETNSHPLPLRIKLFAFCKYPDTYYDPTQNKSNEELKSALKTLLGTATVDLGYNGARDKMFMEIDNWKVNGKGAAVNTLACIYTDSLAVGYTSRSDCQTTFNFNTEHTFPQSMFGSATPMLSDLHHIFPTKDFANTERANNPFGVVTSPTWSVGGSKSNGSVFEPRDAHKGNAARALFYMVFRYSDYTGFVAPQEPILRTWCDAFPPTVWDSTRNADIYLLQNNRNPLVDHPEFLERIASICTADSGDKDPKVWLTQDTLFFGTVAPSTTLDGTLHLSNQGIHLLTASAFTFSDPAFAFVSTPSGSVSRDSGEVWTIRFSPTTPSIDYTSTLTFTTNDPDNPSVTVVLKGDSYPLSTINSAGRPEVNLFPNPGSGAFTVEAAMGMEHIGVCDATGKQVWSSGLLAGLPLRTQAGQALPQGIYLVKVTFPNYVTVNKLLVVHP